MRAGRALAAFGAAGVVVASFLPWSRSGSAVRSGYALARLAFGSSLVDRPLAQPLLVAWLVVPFVAACTLLGLALRSRALTAVSAAACAAVGMVTGIAVLASSLGAAFGPWTSVAAGALAAMGAVRLALGERGHDERSPHEPTDRTD